MSRNKKSVKVLTKPKKRSRGPYDRPQMPKYLAPPHYVQQVVRKVKVRCVASAQMVTNTFTCQQIAAFTGVIGTSAVTGVYITQSFKMTRVSCWGPVATAGTPVTVELKYSDIPGSSGGIASPPRTISDTSVSFDRPAFVSLTPTPDTYFDFWLQANNGSNMLVITCPTGTIFDFDLQFIIDDIGTLPSSRALVAATTGVIYRLIATGSGGQLLTPVIPINSN